MIFRLSILAIAIFMMTFGSALASEESVPDSVAVEAQVMTSEAPYQGKKTTIRFDLGTMLLTMTQGGFGTTFGVDYAISNQFTVGPMVSFAVEGTFNRDELRPVSYLAGFRGQFFTNNAYDNSFYISPGVYFTKLDVDTAELDFKTEGVSLGTTIGYKWMWGQGASFQIGAGALLAIDENLFAFENIQYFPMLDLSFGSSF